MNRKQTAVIVSVLILLCLLIWVITLAVLFGDFNGIGAAYWITWNAFFTFWLTITLWMVLTAVIAVE
jgi:xanthine/uracil permease